MSMYQVVFHIDEGEKGSLVLKNIENLLNHLGSDNVKVELVANSDGITVLIKDQPIYSEQIQMLQTKGVIFAACANTMRQKELTKDLLVDNVSIVPSGVGELVIKQSQGWAYLRP